LSFRSIIHGKFHVFHEYLGKKGNLQIFLPFHNGPAHWVSIQGKKIETENLAQQSPSVFSLKGMETWL
jgi:hypothetical protein